MLIKGNRISLFNTFTNLIEIVLDMIKDFYQLFMHLTEYHNQLKKYVTIEMFVINFSNILKNLNIQSLIIFVNYYLNTTKKKYMVIQIKQDYFKQLPHKNY